METLDGQKIESRLEGDQLLKIGFIDEHSQCYVSHRIKSTENLVTVVTIS